MSRRIRLLEMREGEEEWRVACTTDGVRILLAASSPSASLPPAATAVAHGSSFHAVLADASTERGADARSAGNTAKAPAKNADDHAPKEQAPDGAVARGSDETDAVEATGGKQGAATSDGPQTASLPAATDATLSAELGTDVPAAAVASSSNKYFQHAIVDALVDVGGSVAGTIGAANVPTGEAPMVRTSGKQDRSKEPADSKDASAQTTGVGAVVDLGNAANVNMVSWHVPSPGEASETPVSRAKDAVVESSTEMKGKALAPVEGTTDRAAGVAIVSTGAEQSIATQSPAELFVAGLELPTMAGVAGTSGIAGNAGGGLETAKPMPRGAAAVGDSESFKPADGVSGAKSSASGALDTSSRTVANGTQTAPNTQGDSSKAGAGVVIPRATESAATQTSLQAIAHQAATLQSAATAAPDTTHAAKAQALPAEAHLEGGDAVGASGINSAKLIQTMGETEMHVGMHSAEFGDISIRTSLSQQQMVTEISLDHNDLSQAIATHLSTMQAKLGQDYGLQASIQINNQGSSLSGGQGNSSQRDQQQFSNSSQGKMVVSAELNEGSSSVVALTSVRNGHGLDIRI
jgi:hypothetical protein